MGTVVDPEWTFKAPVLMKDVSYGLPSSFDARK